MELFDKFKVILGINTNDFDTELIVLLGVLVLMLFSSFIKFIFGVFKK